MEPEVHQTVPISGFTQFLGLTINPMVIVLAALLATVVYFGVVMPYTKAKERFFPSAEPEGTPEDIVLLTQIRDALVARGGTPPTV